ncbi:MAG: DUF1015 domain-containing protein [Candidatus Poribacteria bacterium]
MAVIKPFRGLRYGPHLADVIADVMAPPYDVISAEMQEALHERHPANFIRLEYGRDDNGTDRYARARATLDGWGQDGSLIQDDAPSYYLYEQSFTLPEGVDAADGREVYRRRAVFASVQLEPYGSSIFPHEKTLAGPKADRMRLIAATEANLSPIFAIMSDPTKAADDAMADVARRAPLLYAAADEQGQTHRVWRAHGSLADELSRVFADASLTIADGHHRYETALEYRDRTRATNGVAHAPSGADAVLMALVSSQSDELIILPAFRLVSGLDAAVVASLPQRLADSGYAVAEVGAADDGQVVGRLLDSVRSSTVRTFGFCLTGGRLFSASAKPGDAGTADSLDVVHLHERLLPELLGVDTNENAGQSHVRYTVNRELALDSVASGEAQVAVFVRGVTMAEVETVARSGGTMPQKATYFYPKIPSGLVARSLT